jgi:hypothetical protein
MLLRQLFFGGFAGYGIWTLAMLVFARCAAEEPVTPPEPDVDWSEAPVLLATPAGAATASYNPLSDYPDAGTRVPPDAAYDAPPERALEDELSALELHTRHARFVRDSGWCGRFCDQMGGHVLHPDAFRARLSSDFNTYEMYSRCPYDEVGSYDEWNDLCRDWLLSQFEGEEICACEHRGFNHWVLAVPRNKALFFQLHF